MGGDFLREAVDAAGRSRLGHSNDQHTTHPKHDISLSRTSYGNRFRHRMAGGRSWLRSVCGWTVGKGRRSSETKKLPESWRNRWHRGGGIANRSSIRTVRRQYVLALLCSIGFGETDLARRRSRPNRPREPRALGNKGPETSRIRNPWCNNDKTCPSVAERPLLPPASFISWTLFFSMVFGGWTFTGTSPRLGTVFDIFEKCKILIALSGINGPY